MCRTTPELSVTTPEPSRKTPEPSRKTREPSIPTLDRSSLTAELPLTTPEVAIRTPEIAKPTRAKTSLRGNKQTVTPHHGRTARRKNEKQRTKEKEKLTESSPHRAYWPRPPSDPTRGRGHGSNDGGRPVKHPWMPPLSVSALPPLTP